MSASLETFLSSADWHHRFDEEILPQAKKLSSPRFLNELRLDALDDGAYQLSGRLSGQQAEVHLWPEGEERWDFDTDCSCGLGHFCVHSAALFFRASKTGTLTKLLRQTRAVGEMPLGCFQPADESKHSPCSVGVQPAENNIHQTPTFHLRIAEEAATGRSARLLLQALKTPDRDTWLVARPTVRYGSDEVPLAKNAPAPEIPRDQAAEFRARELLASLGLTNLHSSPSYRFLLAIDKNPDPARDPANAWFPEPLQFTPRSYWPWFRATAIPKLAEAGWHIEIDPAFGHHVRSLAPDELDTRLSPVPGGWFTLSVGIDHEGHTIDLLPVLLSLLKSDTLEQLAELPYHAPFLIHLPEGLAFKKSSSAERERTSAEEQEMQAPGGRAQGVQTPISKESKLSADDAPNAVSKECKLNNLSAIQFPAGRLRRILHHLSSLTDPTA
ncbi:MAG: hypothetical protein ACQKBY_07430, partial [Verrucomicrobiales bacterium]